MNRFIQQIWFDAVLDKLLKHLISSGANWCVYLSHLYESLLVEVDELL